MPEGYRATQHFDRTIAIRHSSLMLADRPYFLDSLDRRLPAGGVLPDRDLVAAHEPDPAGRFEGTARAVVRPRSTAEVAAVLEACTRAGVPVVPQGGHTGLVGGATPRDGELVLSLRALSGSGEVDPDTCQVDAEAGATLARRDVSSQFRRLKC
jgi:FAD/FMN-containing dehydrogenase